MLETGRGQRIGALLLLISLGTSARAAAQLPTIGVPRGVARFEVQGDFNSYGQRYHGGSVENYLADFETPALGSAFWPDLAPAETTIGEIIGSGTYRLNLGRVTAQSEVNVGTATFSLALGLTKRLTLLGSVPYVYSRIQPSLAVDSTSGDAGTNPLAGTGGCQTVPFFSQFGAALTTVQDNLNSGAYTGSQQTLANQVLADTTLLRQLCQVIAAPGTASPFLPTNSSQAGAVMNGQISSLQTVLRDSLSVPSFTAPVPLPDARLDAGGYQDFISDLSGPVAGTQVSENLLGYLGDIQVGAAYTLFDHWDSDNRLGGFRSALQATVRLPTGKRDSPNNFVDLGTGRAGYDLNLALTTDLGTGRVGARLVAAYSLRLPVARVRRVSPPTQPIAYLDRLTNVNINPGDVALVEIRPFFRLARTLALQAAFQYWRQGEDQVTYPTPADSLRVPGNISASLLAQDTRASGMTVSGGVTYSNPGALSEGGKGLPLEANWSYAAVIGGSGGRVPRSGATTVAIRFYHRIWH
jgi:hypothetical protein